MNRIKECRMKKGMSQKYVALSLGVAPPSVCTWESGKTQPSRENVAALADLFGVTVDYLLGRDVPPEQCIELPRHGPETMAVIEEVTRKLAQLAEYDDGGVEEISNYADYLLAQRKKEAE